MGESGGVNNSLIMKISERDALIFLATFISTDGHITKTGEISIFSQDKELIDKAKIIIKEAGLNTTEWIDKNEFRTLTIWPTTMAYMKLRKYKQFFLERKLNRLEERFKNRGHEERIRCYNKVMALPRSGKISQGKKGEGLLPRMKKLSKQYNIPISTMQFWYYNHQIPDALHVGIKKSYEISSI